jgi:hypothetical protein
MSRRRPKKTCVVCGKQPRLTLGRCVQCLKVLQPDEMERLRRMTRGEREREFAGQAAVKATPAIPHFEYENPSGEEELMRRFAE